MSQLLPLSGCSIQFCLLLGKDRFLGDEGWAKVGTKERKARSWLRRSRERDYDKWVERRAALWTLDVLSKYLPGAQRESRNSVEGLGAP